jgi:hypothetical protein
LCHVWRVTIPSRGRQAMINLIIKGNMFDAFNAAHARGIALVSAAQPFSDRRAEVVASVDDKAIDAVRKWYLESDGPAPYPAGALLFYSTRVDRGELEWQSVPSEWPAPSPPASKCGYVGCSFCDAENG